MEVTAALNLQGGCNSLNAILMPGTNNELTGLRESPAIGLAIRTLGALLLVLACTVSMPAMANPLADRGIDPAVLDLMISDLSQDIRYTRFTEIEVNDGTETFVDRALIQFDPATDYGIDLIMKFDDSDTQNVASRKYRRNLENRMRLQHRIRTMEITYDPNTLQVESQDGDRAVIKFRYSKFALPQQVAWMRRLQGRIWVNGDRVERIRLELDEGSTFHMDGSRVTEFELEASLVRLSNGLDVIQDTVTRSVSNHIFRPSRQISVEIRSYALSFAETDGTDITPASVSPPAGIDISTYTSTVRVNLDRTFPIFGKEARKAGYEIPKPFGVSVLYSDITTRFDFTSFEINGESQIIEAIFDPNGSGIDIDAQSPQIRFDWFPLPFLNVMALYGKAEADGTLKIRTTGLGQLVGLPEIIEERIEIDTDMWGVGLTAAVGYKNFFGNVTATYFENVTSDADSKSTIVTVTPMVGYFFPDYRLRVLAGAEYFDIDNKMVGSIDLPEGGSLDFNIGVETQEWAWRVGLYKEFGNHFEGTLTYTFGDDRDGISAMFGYRF